MSIKINPLPIGDVSIGAGEIDAARLIARAARSLYEIYPGIHYHIASGNAEFVLEQLEKGLIDFFNYITSGKQRYSVYVEIKRGLRFVQ